MGTWEDSMAYQLGMQAQREEWTTEEAVERAAQAIHQHMTSVLDRLSTGPARQWDDLEPELQHSFRGMARDALSAAGDVS